jgi:hypothetical protein
VLEDAGVPPFRVVPMTGPLPAGSPATATGPGPRRRRPPEPAAGTTWVGIVVSVAGSLLATWFTGLLDGNPSQRLVGAVVGAVLPALLTEALSKGRVRPVVAVLVALLAVVLTYVSLTAADYATSTPPTFPLPPGVQSPTGSRTELRDGVGINVTPTYLECTEHGCSEPVRVSNAGTVPLEVGDIEVAGAYAASFRADPDAACAHHRLEQSGDECSFDVVFTPSGTGERETATVLIHQNLPGDPTFLPVSGVGEATDPDPEVDPEAAFELELGIEVECVHQRSGAADGRDALQVYFPLRLLKGDAEELPGLVAISAVSDSGATGSNHTAVGAGRTHVALPLGESDYAREHLVTVIADPGNDVPEVDEANNAILVRVRVPEHPAESTTPLSCGAEVR